jgi:hypothetical protein
MRVPLLPFTPFPATISCACCRLASGTSRERQHVLDLLALLEHPNALPPALALRLGIALIAHTETGHGGLACEPVGGIAP